MGHYYVTLQEKLENLEVQTIQSQVWEKGTSAQWDTLTASLALEVAMSVWDAAN